MPTPPIIAMTSSVFPHWRGPIVLQIIFLIEKEVLNKKTEAKNGVLYKSNLKNWNI